MPSASRSEACSFGERDEVEAQTPVTVDVGVSPTAPWRWIPPNATVPVGTRVRWTVSGPAPHTVTSDGCGAAGFGDCVFDSGTTQLLQAGGPRPSFEFTFDKAGSYPYYCRLHGTPGGVGQTGSVVVYEPGTQPGGPGHASPFLIQPNASVHVVSPLDGATIVGDSVTVDLAVTGATLRAPVTGITDPRFGHFHLVLDTTIDLSDEVPRTAPGVFHVATNTFTLENLAPGAHTLLVVWGFDNHFPSIRPITTMIRFTTVAAGAAPAGAGQAPASGAAADTGGRVSPPRTGDGALSQSGRGYADEAGFLASIAGLAAAFVVLARRTSSSS